MRFAIALLLAAFAIGLARANDSQQKQQVDLQVANKHNNEDRQGKSLSSSSNGENSLVLTRSQSGSSNQIENISSKSRIEQERRQVQEFLSAKNIFKSVIKLLFGNADEISATSRQVLSILGNVLDLLKNTFGQKSRSGSARTFRDSAEDAATAGVSVLQGYVKSMLANDDRCVQRYLCQASKDATRDSRDFGYIIASVGGYASSYMLEGSRATNFKGLHEASMKGRSMKEDCTKLYPDCPETSS